MYYIWVQLFIYIDPLFKTDKNNINNVKQTILLSNHKVPVCDDWLSVIVLFSTTAASENLPEQNSSPLKIPIDDFFESPRMQDTPKQYEGYNIYEIHQTQKYYQQN